ncbi:MAG: tetratricopeptide repeat protein, partial [Clostridium sp.]
YMEYREKAEENYKMLALDNAFEYSKKAYEIYQEDEVILGILAIYYYYNDKLNMALEYTNRALSINENYYNSCILRGVMLFKEKKYTEALIYFNKPKEYEDDIAKYISNFYHGNCYYKLENFIEAKRLLLNVKCRSKKFLKNDLENTNRRLNGEKVVGENRGIEANDKAVRKFIKAKNRVVKGSKWEIIKFATILFIGLLYLPISVIIKFFGVVFGYNPVKIKSVDNLLALKDETRIKLFITNIRITNYYLVSENKLHYEILKEQEIYDRKLWSYVEAVVLIGKCHERDLLFTGKNFSINDLNVKDHYGTIFGKIDSLDDKTFDKIIMDYDISKQDSIYGRIVMDSKKKTISI